MRRRDDIDLFGLLISLILVVASVLAAMTMARDCDRRTMHQMSERNF